MHVNELPKRLLATLLSAVLAFSLVPSAVWAENISMGSTETLDAEAQKPEGEAPGEDSLDETPGYEEEPPVVIDEPVPEEVTPSDDVPAEPAVEPEVTPTEDSLEEIELDEEIFLDEEEPQVEALSEDEGEEIELEEEKVKNAKGTVSVEAHVQKRGWMKAVGNGKTAGTTGKALSVEALRIRLKDAGVKGDIVYRAHVQKIGWQGWKKNGQVAGTTGRSLRVEAIQAKLTGEAAQTYDLYYRVHVQSIGWLAWASANEQAGTAGFGLRVEAVQVKLVAKNATAPSDDAAQSSSSFISTLSVGYTGYVQGKGWTKTKKDGKTAGATGKALRLEGLRVALIGETNGRVSYRVSMQGSGWQDWTSDDGVAGLPDAGKRMEAVQIKLGGDASKVYNVWYRVHSQSFGWMGWTKAGASAGTTGMGLRIEAIQIRLLPKSSSAPGSTTTPFFDGSIRQGLSAASGSRSVTSFGGHRASSGAVKALNNAISGLRGRGYEVGFIMMDINTKKGVAYNCDKRLYGASSIKAPYIASAVSAHPEAIVRYEHNIRQTLTYSWDYDYKQVYYGYGKGPMRTWCTQAGVRTGIAESLPWAGYSARELAKLWGRNYLLFKAGGAGETFGKWCEHPQVSTIHNSLGGKYRTRSKAGWIVDASPYYNVSDDGGIVYANNGPYVIAIMSSVPANQNMLNTLTKAIDRAHSEI